jgi:hypothetical protein
MGDHHYDERRVPGQSDSEPNCDGFADRDRFTNRDRERFPNRHSHSFANRDRDNCTDSDANRNALQ